MTRLIVVDYNAMNVGVNAESRNYPLEEDKDKLRFLQESVDEDLARVLTPEQAIDCQIERDGYMRGVRQRLELFKPTVQELRDFFKIRRRIGLDVEARNMNMNRFNELQRTFLVELSKKWGPERYAQYARLVSLAYLPTYHLVRRLNLPPEFADKIFDSRREAVKKDSDAMDAVRAAQPSATAMRGVNPGEMP